MSGALDPVQPDLPFEPASGQAGSPTPSQAAEPGPGSSGSAPWKPKEPAPLPPSLYDQLWKGLRNLPWSRWRAEATPIIRAGAMQVRTGAGQLGGVVKLAISRGTPYTVKLAKASAQASPVRGIPLWIAKAIHLVGLPAVVLRTAVQLLIAHRTGLAIEQVVFFRTDDPAGYTVYEAPGSLGVGFAVAFIPTLVLAFLALICLIPALTPRAALHLPVTWLTWVQVWLGLSFAAHALPTYEEAGPLAEQARVGVREANPAGLLGIVPAQLATWLARFGGLIPAVAGSLFLWWLAGIIVRI